MGSMAELNAAPVRPLELPVCALKEAVPFYEAFFPDKLLKEELENEMRAAEVVGAVDATLAYREILGALQGPEHKAERRYVRALYANLRPGGTRLCDLPTPSPDEREYLVQKDLARVRRALISTWLTILYEGCATNTWSLPLDHSLLPPYTPLDGGSWKNAIISRPSVHLLRREACERVFDAFVLHVKTHLEEQKRLPLFSLPKASLKIMPSGPALYFG